MIVSSRRAINLRFVVLKILIIVFFFFEVYHSRLFSSETVKLLGNGLPAFRYIFLFRAQHPRFIKRMPLQSGLNFKLRTV